MFKHKKVLIFTLLFLTVGFGSYFVSERYFTEASKMNFEEKNGFLSKKIPEKKEDTEIAEREPEVVETAVMPKILPSTKFIYEYYYLKDNIVKKEEGFPMTFLLDKTFEEVRDMYPDWNILSFSEKEVVMRKLVNEESEEHYIIGQKDGYITVFYEEEKDGTNIYRITNITIEGLSEAEKRLLNDGIYVTGENNLSKALEDYGS